MEGQIFKDKDIYPSDELIKNSLDNSFIYDKFLESLKELNLFVEYHYYNDGKAWLGKILNCKNKNMGWVSLWNTGFKVTIYFTVKTLDGFMNLDISNISKDNIDTSGKLIPILTLVDNIEILDDLVKVLEYKIGLK